MNVYVISFCLPMEGVFGLVENAFFDEIEAKKALATLKHDQPDFEFVLDVLTVEMTLQ